MPLFGCLWQPIILAKQLFKQMLVSYMLQYMDKGVMAQAAVYDIIPSLGLKGQDYSWCS